MTFCGIFALVVLVIDCANASHFRGGTISWDYLRLVDGFHEVRFSFRLGWRRDSGEICDAAMISNRTEILENGQWTLSGAATSSAFPHSTATKCTSFDIAENWSYGFNDFLANITTSGKFNVIFAGGDWINSLAFGGGSDWSVALVDVDFDTRSDTSDVNHPPSALSSPVIKIQQGCPTTIQINAIDEDGDRISCRYAEGDVECAGICGDYSHFSLNKTTCTIRYDGGGNLVTVPVALMLDDHPRQTITLGRNRTVTTSDALSSIPLQLLVNITRTNDCNVIPTYPNSTIKGNSTIILSRKESLNETIFAQPSDPIYKINQFVVIGPVGLKTSEIFSPLRGLYASFISWKPEPSQAGDHLVCYYAVDSNGQSGEQICFTITAPAQTNPCDVDNGGCSDVCVPRRSSSRCKCANSCWKLAKDGKTCTPNMEVTCDGYGVGINVARCASTETVVAGTHLSHFTQSICQSVETQANHSLRLDSSDCGLEFKSDSVHHEYVLAVWIWESFNEHSIITRGEWRKIPVTCSLPRTGNLSASFLPTPTLNDDFFPDEIDITGMGHFSLYFEFHRNSSFEDSFSPEEYPIKVNVNDKMSFSLGANGREGMVFFTEQCVAMTNTTAETSSIVYPFIEDGCLIDPTLTRHVSSNAMQNRFSMRAFEFKQKLLVPRENAEIFIQCEVIICNATANGTRCDQGCLSSSDRRKRSADQDKTFVEILSRMTEDRDGISPPLTIEESPPQDVRTRFVLIADSASNAGSEAYSSVNYTTWILIAFSAVILVMACFITYRVVKKQKRRKEDDATA